MLISSGKFSDMLSDIQHMDPDGLAQIVASNDARALQALLEEHYDLIVYGRNFSLKRRQLSQAGEKTEKMLLPMGNLSLLHVAAFYDNLEIFLFLESNGIPLDVKSGDSYAPLHYACAGGAVECVAYILEKRPDQATEEFDCQWQPIFIATFANSPSVLEMLFDHGASLATRRNLENRPFEQALRSGHMECLMILLTHKCRTNVRSEMSPLMFAESWGMGQALEPLLDLGLDPYFVSPSGKTVLSLACSNNDIQAVKLLCERMEYIEIPIRDGRCFSSIARYAISSKNLEILRIVLNKGGVELNRYDSNSDLAADAIRGVIDDDLGVKMLEILIAYGFDVNTRSPQTKKAFIDRVIEYTLARYPKIVEFLLQHGADVRTQQQDGSTLLEKVKKFQKQDSRYKSPVQKMYLEIFKRYFPKDMSETDA